MPAIKNNAFLLGEATLMLAPYSDATSVFDLNPSTHSIGLVRNVQVTEESDKIELRKGIQQLLVDSKKSNVRVGLSAEVFEFNAQNLMYSLSQARTAVAPKRGKLKNAVTGPAATFIVNTDPLPGESATGISVVGDIPNGATLVIQHATETDYVLPVRVTATTTVATLDFTVTAAVPTGTSFPVGSKVWVVNEIALGDTTEQDFFKAKIVGTLSNNSKPMVVVLPKVKIMKGFALNFDEGNYTSMPFEFDPYMLNASEAVGRLAEIGTSKMIHAYAAG
jgi:hypothetical protein